MEPLSPRAVNIQTRPRAPTKAYMNPVKAKAPPSKGKDPVPEPPPVVIQPPIGQSHLSEKYKIGNHLGKGGFAVCYEGELQCRKYNMQDRVYALKTVPAMMNNKKMEEKFRTELQIHAKMHHPNIVEFHRAFTYMDNTYLVLELCRSGSVMDLVKKRGCLSLPEIRRLTVQLCGAVKYMHARNVIHRDLKMGNLFLDQDMNLKLGDFGLAAVLVSKSEYDGVYNPKFSRRTTLCGTPNYIAPEILEKGKGGHDHKVDIWAMGVILFAMITGLPPFQAGSQDEIYRKARSVEYYWPDGTSGSRKCQNDIPLEAKDLVASLLRVDAETRPSPDEIIGQPFFSMHGGNAMPLTLDPSCRRQKPVWLLDETPRGDVMDGLTPRLELSLLAKQCGVGHLEGNSEPYQIVGENVDISLYKECVAEERAETSPVVPLPVEMVYSSTLSIKTWPNQRSPSPDTRILSASVHNDENIPPLVQAIESKLKAQHLPQASHAIQPRRAPFQSHAATLRAAQVGPLPSRGLSRAMPSVNSVQNSVKALEIQNYSRARPTKRLLNELPVRPNAGTSSNGPQQVAPVPRQSSRVTRSASAKPSIVEIETTDEIANNEASERDNNQRERAAKTEARIAVTVQEEMEKAVLRQRGSRRTKRTPSRSTSSRTPRNSVLISPDEVAETLVGTSPSELGYNLRQLRDELARNLDSPCPEGKDLEHLRARARRSAKDRPVILKWVDYSHKFGIGYILENGTVGSILNGENGNPPTAVAVAGAEEHLKKRRSPSYIDRHQVVPREGAPIAFFEDCREEGFRRVLVPGERYYMKDAQGVTEDFCHGIDSYDQEKRNRLFIWNKFARYMTQSLGKSDGPTSDSHRSDLSKLNCRSESVGPFIRFYQRLGNVGVWGFGDGSFQINFPDHTKLVVSHDGSWLDFYHLSIQAAQILKRGEILKAASLIERSVLRYPTSVMMSGSYQGHDFQRVILENQLAEKITFVKDMVDSWCEAGGLGCMGSKHGMRWEGMGEKEGKLVWVTIGAFGGDQQKTTN